MSRYLSKLCCLKGKWVILAQILGGIKGRGSSNNDFWRQKTRVPGLRGVVCVILRLVVLVQYWRLSHTQTDGHTMMANTRALLAMCG